MEPEERLAKEKLGRIRDLLDLDGYDSYQQKLDVLITIATSRARPIHEAKVFKDGKWSKKYSSIPFTLNEREIYLLKLTPKEYYKLEKQIYPFWDSYNFAGNSPYKHIWKKYFTDWVILIEEKLLSQDMAANQILGLALKRYGKVPSKKILIKQFSQMHREFKKTIPK